MEKELRKDIELFNKLAKDFLKEEITNPVSKFIPPEKLASRLDISLSKDPISVNEYIQVLQKILKYTPKSSSRLFFNQLFGGRNSKAVLGDLLATILNNSMATYKVAGPQVAIEKEVIKQVCNRIGYKKESGGTFPTGGSMSNFMSLIMARDRKDISSKKKGITKKLIAYTSEAAHYSIEKNASFSGLGKDNIRYIQANEKGQIDVQSLEKTIIKDIKEGMTPFYVNATAGTTVVCAFDDIEPISKICKKHDVWLHLDGALGGTVIFSEKHKSLVKGIAKTDSFCFNAHKTLGAPLSTSVLVVNKRKHLLDSFDSEASYLYQTHNNEFNLGRSSLECGRRNNALKLWSMWKALGTNGLARIVEHEFSLAVLARSYIKNNSDYVLYDFFEGLTVCFNYKGVDPKELCLKLYEENKLLVGFGTFKKTTFIRLVTINSELTEEDILNFFKKLEFFVANNM